MDIFDQIAPKSGGDIFDKISPEKKDIFDEQEPKSFLGTVGERARKLGGAAEVAASMATSAVSWIPAGAYMAGSALTPSYLKGPDEQRKMAETANKIQETLTYTPKIFPKEAAEQPNPIGEAFGFLNKTAETAGGWAAEKIHPAAGAAVETGIKSLPFFVPSLIKAGFKVRPRGKAPITEIPKKVAPAPEIAPELREVAPREAITPEAVPVEARPVEARPVEAKPTKLPTQELIPKEVTDYKIQHRPMTTKGGAATLDDLTPAFGDDIYGKSARQYFGANDIREIEALKIFQKVRNKPDLTITIYRAVPQNIKDIAPGDWVTVVKSVADDYASLEKGSKVIQKDVLASDVTAWADSLLEQGYHPKEKISTLESLEAGVKGGQISELPKYAEKSSINLERIEGGQDLKQFINQMALRNEKQIGRKTMTVDEIKTRAEGLGLDEKSAVRLAKSHDMYSSDMAAVEQIHRNVADDVFNKLREIPTEAVGRTDEMRADLADLVDHHSQLLVATSRMKSEWGRAGVMQRQMKKYDPEFMKSSRKAQVIDAVIKKYGREKIDEVIDTLKTIDPNDSKAMAKFIRDLNKPTAWDHIKRLMYDAYLSLPTTHEANMIGNAMRFAWKYPEKAVSAGGDILYSALSGKPRKIFAGEIGRDIFSLQVGIQKGVKAAWETIKTGETKGGASKFEDIGRGAQARLPGKVGQAYEYVRPTTILKAADELAKGMIYESELASLAYRKASQLGLKGEARTNKIVELLHDETIKQEAWQSALNMTWQDEMGKIGNAILKLRNVKIPGTQVQPLVPLIPFIQTGTNIAKFTLQASPAHIPYTIFKGAKKMIGREAVTQEIARSIVGTAVGTTAYLMATNGYITGGGPKNPTQRAALYRTGWQPYSLTPKFSKKIGLGDKYIAISRYEPVSSLFGMAADLYEGIKQSSEDEKFKLANSMLRSVSKNITSKTWWMGVTNLINAYMDPDRYGSNLLENLVRTPIPAIGKGIARTIDPYMRNPQTFIESFKVGVPGLSQQVAPRLDVWGQPVKQPGPALSRLISPSRISEETGSKVDQEIVRLKMSLGMPSKKIKDVKLEPKEWQWLVMASGKPAKQYLDRLVQSPQWSRTSDEEKEKAIRSVVQGFRDEAREQLIDYLISKGRLQPPKEE